MRALTFITGVFTGFLIVLIVGMNMTASKDRHLQTVYIEGDEMPGLAASDDVPDTCYAWYDQQDRNFHIAGSWWTKPKITSPKPDSAVLKTLDGMSAHDTPKKPISQQSLHEYAKTHWYDKD